MALRSRKAVVAFALETVSGTDAAPNPATQSILVEALVGPTPAPNVIKTDEVNQSLDDYQDIVGGMTFDVKFDIYLKGQGAAGTVPQWDALMQACGWKSTATATPIPAAPEAAAAGSSTTQGTLGVSAAATAEIYRGMPITLSGDVTPTFTTFISDYTAAKLATFTDTISHAVDATTNYQIPANVLYSPFSGAIQTGTMYVYRDGKRWRLVGCAGNADVQLVSGGPGKISFTFKGLFEDETDTALPTPTYDATRPPIWKNAFALVNRRAAQVQAFSLKGGMTMTNPDNPNSLEGFDPAILTRRHQEGEINPLEVLVGTQDLMTTFRTQGTIILHGRYGIVAGNNVGLTIPAALLLNKEPQDRNLLVAARLPYRAVGLDAGAFLCVY